MTLVVNFFAGPGAGKSTCTAATFAQLKYSGFNVEIASEWVKESVWEGRDGIVKNQIYIFAKQLKRILDPMGKVDVILTDSPILLSLYYNNGLNEHLDRLVLSEHNKMETINVFLIREKPYSSKGRWQTEAEAKESDVWIKNLLDEHNIDYVVLPGNELTPGILVDMIRNKLEAMQEH